MPTLIDTRRAGIGDIDAVLADVEAGFATYAEFAQPGWRPPKPGAGREGTAELLGAEGTWALRALVGGAPVGHVAFIPGRRRRAGESGGDWRNRALVPGLAHFWQLFVLPAWWGAGVASLLHDAAADEMRAQGYSTARLFTPSLHARARRLSERREWRAVDEEWNDGLDVLMTEYRLDLGPSGSRGQSPPSHPSR
jgi:GNAT superfamily N-acetyltransferase